MTPRSQTPRTKSRSRDTANHHTGVPNCLAFLQPMLFSQAIAL
ncbi:MAG TPA: hypothetical protein V6D12_05380 [Candidatus Obscuribacterales bacterium]